MNNKNIKELEEKLRSSQKRLSNISLEKTKEEERIKELEKLIEIEKSKPIVNFQNGDIFTYCERDVIIIVPYGWQPYTKNQLYWWADRNLNPYSMSPSYNGATKEQMLDQLNRLPNIKFVGNIRNVELPI